MLRKIQRNIARNRMRKAGVEHISKPGKVLKGRPTPSKFQQLWKQYL